MAVVIQVLSEPIWLIRPVFISVLLGMKWLRILLHPLLGCQLIAQQLILLPICILGFLGGLEASRDDVACPRLKHTASSWIRTHDTMIRSLATMPLIKASSYLTWKANLRSKLFVLHILKNLIHFNSVKFCCRFRVMSNVGYLLRINFKAAMVTTSKEMASTLVQAE